MPKYAIQWKDPDYVDARTGEWVFDDEDREDNSEYEKLRQLGMGEYIVIEFDTDTMTATVRPRKVK